MDIAKTKLNLIESIDRFNQEIIERITGRAVDLNNLLDRKAKAEGQLDVVCFIERMMFNGFTFEQANMLAVDNVLRQGSDDEWSGRGNDLRRSFFDGKMVVISDIMTDIVR
jgi:hypothetical protein